MVILTTFLVLPAAQGQFSCWTNNGAITVWRYDGTNADVVIPDTIDSLPVTGIPTCFLAGSATSIYIPSKVVSIAPGAFNGCYALTAFLVDPSNPRFSGVDGVLFNKSQDTLIACPHAKAGACIIPTGVSTIGQCAFQYCYTLTNVTIPSTVTNIGAGAFSCTALTALVIPAGVTVIDDDAFGSSNLRGIYFQGNAPKVNGSLGEWYITKAYCYHGTTGWSFDVDYGSIGGLTLKMLDPSTDCAYSISNGVASVTGYYGAGASLIIPSQIEGVPVTISNQAFKNCTNLTRVVISEGVTSIGDEAFENCTSLTSVVISEGVTNIGDQAFENCSGITNLVLPSSLAEVGVAAFASCRSLPSVTIPGALQRLSSSMFYRCDQLTWVVLDGGVAEIGSEAFAECTRLRSIIIPDSVINIGDEVFEDCQSLASVALPSSASSMGEGVFVGCVGLASCTMPKGISAIPSEMFYGCESLTTITIPDSVVTIGFGAFEWCSSLQAFIVDDANPVYRSVDGVVYDKSKTTIICYPAAKSGIYTIPVTVTNIATFAFSASKLQEIVIPDTVSQMGEGAFSGSDFTTVVISKSIISIPNGAFGGCRYLRSVNISGNVTSIGDSAFVECGSLADVVLAEGVKTIGNWAFTRCSELTHVSLPDSLTEIGSEAFEGCQKLRGITIPPNVTNIQNLAFSGCECLGNIKIPNTITRINEGTFSHCTALTNVFIGDSVTNIGPEAFSSCSRLASLRFGTNLAEIGDEAFENCTSLARVTLPTQLIRIGKLAFAYCVRLGDVTIGRHVTDIGLLAFAGAPKLVSVLFLGDAPNASPDAFQGDDQAIIYYLQDSWFPSGSFCNRPAFVRGTKLGIPILTAQPRSVSALRGKAVSFSVRATGNNLTYRWFKDGYEFWDDSHISGSSSNTITIDPVHAQDSGAYSVIVANDSFSVPSRDASLRVILDAPKVRIASQGAWATVTNGTLTVSGTAWSRVGIAHLSVWLNDLTTISVTGNAAPGNDNMTQWSATGELSTPGMKWLYVWATDWDGASSLISNRINYVETTRVIVKTQGAKGGFAPNLNSKFLEVEKAYAITAKAAPGCLFSNWTGGISPEMGVLTNSARLKFVMQSNLVLQANFVTNPFPAHAGAYSGLFYGIDGVTVSNSGAIGINVTSSGAFSAKVRQGPNAWVFSGRFGLDGHWDSDSARPAQMRVSLDLDFATGQISGSVKKIPWLAQLLARHNGKLDPVAQAEHYTMTIPGSDDPATRPPGWGAFALSVSPLGAVTIAGSLADGESVFVKSFLSKDGQIPIYFAPYSGKGTLTGWLTLTNGHCQLYGQLDWIKPKVPGAKFYPDGFSMHPNGSMLTDLVSVLTEPSSSNSPRLLNGPIMLSR